MTQQQDQPVIRIGELLVRSGVITAYDLSEAEKLSSHMKVQFGRLLIMAGCLTEEALECALEAQGLIRDGLLTPEIACEALAFAVQESIPLRQALEMLDCLPQFGTSTLRLAELIHDANIIDEEKLHDAFDTSMETNRPLPEVLVEMQCISPGLLSIMLRMQEQIRNETLDRDDAINELKGTFKIWKRADKAMAGDPMSKSAIIGVAPTAPIKPSRYTSSFDSVTRLPAMSPEILAGLNAQENATGSASGSDTSALPPAAHAPSSSQPVQFVPPPQSQQPQHIQNQMPGMPSMPTPGSLPQHSHYPQQPPQSLPPQQQRANQPAQNRTSSYPGSGANANLSGAAGTAGGGANIPGGRTHDDLNVDWILQDFGHAGAGQPMPDGVILYSQGYFPPDEKKPAEETFADGFSDEDEARINALLDVFASDVSSNPALSSPEEARTDGNEVSNADSWLIAADGWGVPDLAAAGANLTGAEMFAKAQADLSSSGWSYNQHSPSPTARAGETAGNQPPSSPQATPTAAPIPIPPPIGQPVYATPAPPLPSTAPKVDVAASQNSVSPQALSGSSLPPSSVPAAAAPVAPTAPTAPTAKTPTTQPSDESSPNTAGTAKSAQTSGPSVSAQPSSIVSRTLYETAAFVDDESDADAEHSNLSENAQSAENAERADGAHSEHSQRQEAAGSMKVEASAPSAPSLEAAESQSLFSAKLKETMTEVSTANPFKIRKVVSESSPAHQNLQSGELERDVEGAEPGKNPDENDRADGGQETKDIPDNFSPDSDAPGEEPPAHSDSTADASQSHDNEHSELDDSSSSTNNELDESARVQQSASLQITGDGGELDRRPTDGASDALHEKSRVSEPVEKQVASDKTKLSGARLNLSARKTAEKDEEKPSSDLISMLEAAQFFSYDELETAIVNGLNDQTIAAELLGVLGILDKANLDAAIRLHKLVKTGSVDAKKAISALNDLKAHKIRPADLTEQLGIKKSKRRK